MLRVLSAALLSLCSLTAHAGVIGNLDSAPVTADSFQLKGWACSTGVAQSIQIHMYVGGPYGTGTNLGSATADQISEAAVSNVCQTSGVRHRYLVTLPESVRQAHANKLIYVYGISPTGGANALLSGSGALRVPAPLSVTRRYVYDDALRLCKVIEPETNATVSHYDVAGNLDWSASGLVGLTDPQDCEHDAAANAPSKATRTYDARNRIKTLAFSDGKGNTTWTYAQGRIADMTVDNGGGQLVSTQYTYNRRGLTTREAMVWPAAGLNWPIDYAYNGLGHLSSQTWHGLTVDYAPNALGQPTKAGTFATNVSYHPGGAIKQFTYGNGIVHSMTQNTRGLPDRSLDSYAGMVDAIDDSYAYDANGNVVSILDGATASGHFDRKMVYDDLDRLVRAESEMFGPEKTSAATYAYDGVDNLLQVSIPGTTARDHHYCYETATNRLTSIMSGSCSSSGVAVAALAYDDDRGNVTQHSIGGGRNLTYQFDFGNRLRTVTEVKSPAPAVIASYVYDAHGRRVRDATTASKYSQYSGAGQLVQANDLRTGVFSEYVYLGGSLVAIRERTGASGSYVYATKYQHTDALGSPVAVTDASRGFVGERNEYEPYGQVIKPVSPKDGPGYTGHVLDANTELNYMQQRYYDPQIGRFLSVDPVVADASGGRDFNRYWYANNNSFRFMDPDGRYSCEASVCDTIKAFVKSLRDSRDKQQERRDQRRLDDLLRFIGTEGSGGPRYISGELKGDSVAKTDQKGTTTIDTSKVNNPAAGAMAISHEASHDMDVEARERPATTKNEVRASEVKAYATEATVGKGLGINITRQEQARGVAGSVKNWEDRQKAEEAKQ